MPLAVRPVMTVEVAGSGGATCSGVSARVTAPAGAPLERTGTASVDVRDRGNLASSTWPTATRPREPGVGAASAVTTTRAPAATNQRPRRESRGRSSRTEWRPPLRLPACSFALVLDCRTVTPDDPPRWPVDPPLPGRRAIPVTSALTHLCSDRRMPGDRAVTAHAVAQTAGRGVGSAACSCIRGLLEAARTLAWRPG